MRVLVWQWGRRGAMPRFALELARGCAAVPGITAQLSLSESAEICPQAGCDLPIATYRGALGCVLRLACWPVLLVQLLVALRTLRPDVAIGVHAGPLDPVFALALRCWNVPFFLMVHDAQTHPGDRRGVMLAQRATLSLSAGAIVLSGHVATALEAQGYRRPILRTIHPPFHFGPIPPAPRAHGGRLRLLFFGRLLAYKGLDLLADLAVLLSGRDDWEMRVVGQGPDGPALDRLRACPAVLVENRWVPETELATLLAWADCLVLPYREASQSGVAAAAMAAQRYVIATDIGGLGEQCRGHQRTYICPPTAHDLLEAVLHLMSAPVESLEFSRNLSEISWQATANTLLSAICEQVLRKS